MSDPSMISSLTFKPATDAAKAGFEALAPTAQRSDLAKLIGERISSSGLSMPLGIAWTPLPMSRAALFSAEVRATGVKAPAPPFGWSVLSQAPSASAAPAGETSGAPALETSGVTASPYHHSLNVYLGLPPFSQPLPPLSGGELPKFTAAQKDSIANAVNHLAQGGESFCLYFSGNYPSLTSQLQVRLAGFASLSATAQFYQALRKDGATVTEKVLKGLLAGTNTLDFLNTILGFNLGPTLSLAGFALKIADDVYEAWPSSALPTT